MSKLVIMSGPLGSGKSTFEIIGFHPILRSDCAELIT
jgi:predicted ABC-type ATPase